MYLHNWTCNFRNSTLLVKDNNLVITLHNWTDNSKVNGQDGSNWGGARLSGAGSGWVARVIFPAGDILPSDLLTRYSQATVLCVLFWKCLTNLCAQHCGTCMITMASRRILLVVYIFMVFLILLSTFLKLCPSNTLVNLDTYGFEQFKRNSTVECNVHDCKYLGRVTLWAMVSKSMFTVGNRKERRRNHISTRKECNLDKYLSIMIIL